MKTIQKILSLLFFLTMVVFIWAGSANAENSVRVEVSHVYFSGTSDNSVTSGSVFEWNQSWLLNMMNDPDGGGTLTSPMIVLQSDLPFTGLWPDDLAILDYDAAANTYTWNFGNVGATVPEPAHLNVNCAEQNMSMPIFFDATRQVIPEIIDQDIVVQTITVTFTLDQALPAGVNSFRMGLGGHMQAYGWEPLLERKVISQNQVSGWSTATDGVSAHWYPDNPQNIALNQELTFISQIEVKKSSGLVGNPTYIPTVMIGYSETTNLSQQHGNSITMSHSEGPIVTYTVDNNDVVWLPFTTANRYEFNFNSMIEASGYLITGQVTDTSGAPLADAVMLGLPNTPVTDANGYYGEVVDPGWSGTITPQLAGYQFEPSSQSYQDVMSDQTDQNFIGAETSDEDSDNDGIPDTEDACPDSYLDLTVFIDGCDTGVWNVISDNGCTLADMIHECVENAKNHGAFVSCIAHLTNTWKKQGLISGKDKGRIQSCAAKADLP